MSVFVAIAVIVGASLAVALILTPAVRSFALRVGAVTRPSADRWRKLPTALLGGVVIVFATATGIAVATLFVGDGWAVHPLALEMRPALGVGLAAALMFSVGLVDDVVRLRPQAKFLPQLVAGVTLLSLGSVLHVTPWYVVNVVATLFWFVALTNAFNLLDGLDGVAAGVGAIAAFFLGLTFARAGAWWHASVAWSLAGATLGFVRYNFNPASIFMGDSGSLFLGSVLAGLVAASPTAASASLVSVLFVPLAIVAVPLLDTTLVTVTRVLAGRPIYEGGLDHSTYRLIALGLSERQVAVLLYGFAAVGGVVAMGLTRLDSGLGYVLGTAFLVAMSLLAAYLGHIRVSAPAQVRRMKPVTVLVRSLFYRRRLAEILLDASLITVAYYGAYRLRFDGALPPEYATVFQTTVGLMIAVTVVALGLFGVYRGAWQYAGIFDVYRIVGALTVSAGLLLAYGEWRVPTLAHSHSIVYVDALLAMALLLASRLSFKSLETLRQRLQLRGDRVLIYGADDGGELTLRELVNHSELRLRPVCFVDDDSRRHGTNIHGVPIVAGFDGIAWAVSRYRVDKIVIGTRNLAPETVSVIEALAQGLGLGVAQVSFGVKWLVPGSTAAAGAVAVSGATPHPMLLVGGNGNGHELGPAVAARLAVGPDDATLTDLQAAG